MASRRSRANRCADWPLPLLPGNETTRGLDGLDALALQPADVGLPAVEDDEAIQALVPEHLLERLGEERAVAVVAERLDGLGRGFEDLRDHVGAAAAGVDGAGEDDHPVVRREGVVVAEAVLDGGERVLDVRPGLLRLDVRRLGVLLRDVGDDVRNLLVRGM